MIGLNLFISQTIYVRIYENRMVLKELGSNPKTVTVLPKAQYSTKRLLIGDIISAEETLQRGLKDLLSATWRHVRPSLNIIPLEKADDYSMIEKKSLMDLCEHAGARLAYLYLGPEMTPEQEAALAIGKKWSQVF